MRRACARPTRARAASSTAPRTWSSTSFARRLGGTFTLDELADLYGDGTDWVADQVQSRFFGTDSSAAVNAGFLRYAQRASDYAGGRRRLKEEAAENA